MEPVYSVTQFTQDRIVSLHKNQPTFILLGTTLQTFTVRCLFSLFKDQWVNISGSSMIFLRSVFSVTLLTLNETVWHRD